MTRTARPARPRSAPTAPVKSAHRFPWTPLAVFLTFGLLGFYAWLWLAEGESVSAALVLGPLLIVLTIPSLIRANRTTLAFDLAGVMLLGLVIRFGFAYYRFEHAADALTYHAHGIRLGDAYRNFNFDVSAQAPVPGTGGLNVISGVVHAFVGNDFFATFMVMTWLSFLGCYFLYRAFVTALGDGDHYRYARLLFLWPSMAFWPSSLGKDAWMIFTIGLTSYGAARVFRRLAGGYSLMVLGSLGASLVRPHLAVLAVLAFMIALVIGRRHSTRTTVTPGFLAKLAGLAIIIMIASVLVSRTQELLDIEDFSGSSLQRVATTVGLRTDTGNSAFDPPNPRSLTGFVEAAATVLYRPFLSEARTTEQLVAAVEGMLLAIVTVHSLKRLLTVPRRLRSQPYVMYALVYVLLWVLAFGVIGNFGILTRQRTQMYPFFFVLLSHSVAAASRSHAMSKARAPR
jgi:hypothetical protein